MRISDWSSDVCSSDLDGRALRIAALAGDRAPFAGGLGALRRDDFQRGELKKTRCLQSPAGDAADFPGDHRLDHVGQMGVEPVLQHRAQRLYRSEEHTSELQSLMRISYAVFCLKKKKKEQQIIVRQN